MHLDCNFVWVSIFYWTIECLKNTLTLIVEKAISKKILIYLSLKWDF